MQQNTVARLGRLGVRDATAMWRKRAEDYRASLEPAKPVKARSVYGAQTAMDREYNDPGHRATPYSVEPFSYPPACTPREMVKVALAKAHTFEWVAQNATSRDEMESALRVAESYIALAAKAELFT